jgi:DNA-binding transcriptional MerR regulator
MPKQAMDKAALLQKTGIAEERLDKLIEAQVVTPAGKVDGAAPYFDETTVEALEPVLKLLDIGYSIEDVVRIRRKVGLPGRRPARKGEPRALLTVGELGSRIGSNPRTIKHWEEKGIIEPDSHSPGGFRLYGEAYVQLCLLIQDLQLFGYSLDEIKVVADFFRDFVAIKGGADAVPAARAAEKLRLMNEKIAELSAKMDQLEQGTRRWRALLRERQKEIAQLAARVDREVKKTGRGPAAARRGKP